jgi:hypothetical protein
MKLMPKHRSIRQQRFSGIVASRGRASRKFFPQRWLQWAHAVMSRYGRAPQGQRGLWLVFRRSLGALETRIQRWQQVTSVFAPLIHLSISPILRQSVNRKSTLAAGGQAPTLVTVSQTEQVGSAKPIIAHRVRREISFAAVTSHRAQAQARDHLQRQTTKTPITRVLTRVNHEAAQPGFSHWRYEAKLLERSMALVKRVIDERQRIEEHASQVVLTRELRAQPGALASSVSEPRSQPFEEFNIEAAKQNRPPASSLLDIESLTDQVVRCIDGRMLAHRERMGRVF